VCAAVVHGKFCLTTRALRSAGHLENVQPGTEADRRYNS
jgi:hypothetical protein